MSSLIWHYLCNPYWRSHTNLVPLCLLLFLFIHRELISVLPVVSVGKSYMLTKKRVQRDPRERRCPRKLYVKILLPLHLNNKKVLSNKCKMRRAGSSSLPKVFYDCSSMARNSRSRQQTLNGKRHSQIRRCKNNKPFHESHNGVRWGAGTICKSNKGYNLILSVSRYLRSQISI